MGRHQAPAEPPPPKDKPRYRFLVAIGGIAALALLTMAIVAAVFPDQRPPEAAANTGDPFPVVTAPIPGPAPGANPTAATPGPSRTSPPPAPATTTAIPPNAPPPTGDVSGAFAVAQTWDTGFIGGVQLANAMTSAQAWQVTVVFPASVGALTASWVEGGPGIPVASRSGQTVTFRGGEPLAAGAHVGLKFQFEKGPGSFAPTGCTVNGRPCG